MTYQVDRFQAHTPASRIAASVRNNGVAIVENLIPDSVMDTLLANVEPELNAQSTSGDFFGSSKRSVAALFARDVKFSEYLLLNECILGVTDAILLPECPMATGATRREPPKPDDSGYRADFFTVPDPAVGPNCHHYRVNASVAMQVCKDGENQTLHRDQWRYQPYMHRNPNGPELTMAIIIAGTDFTAANGATRFIPGSNHWPSDQRRPSEEETVQAEMPKGSAAFWLGSVYHGLGINHTDQPRTGFIFSYGVDHIAQEENQFLSVPPDIAATLPPKAQQLLGYRMSPALNWVVGRDMDFALQPGRGSVLEK